jgi:hypothetical protein
MSNEDLIQHRDRNNQEPEDNAATEEPGHGSPFKKVSPPLFVRDSPEGPKGNAQDEKDETEE